MPRDDDSECSAFRRSRKSLWATTRKSRGLRQHTPPPTPSTEISGNFASQHGRTPELLHRRIFLTKHARNAWLEEASTEAELRRRTASDFLSYQNASGDFADFHSNRHTFISMLGREGVPLTIAQKLARHSDPRLTANRYTHLEMQDKEEAIHGLPTPMIRADYSDGETVDVTAPDSVVTGMVTGSSVFCCPGMASDGSWVDWQCPDEGKDKPFPEQGLDAECQQLSSIVEVHPRGFEPLTFGSVDRCSVQLS